VKLGFAGEVVWSAATFAAEIELFPTNYIRCRIVCPVANLVFAAAIVWSAAKLKFATKFCVLQRN